MNIRGIGAGPGGGGGGSTPAARQRPQNIKLGCRDGHKRYYKLLPIRVDNTSSRVYKFPSDDTIRKSNVLAIEAFGPADFALGPNGEPMVTGLPFPKSFITLKSADNNEEIVTLLNLERIRPANNSGEPFYVCAGAINPSDCFITVSDTSGLAVGDYFFIGIHFERNTAE